MGLETASYEDSKDIEPEGPDVVCESRDGCPRESISLARFVSGGKYLARIDGKTQKYAKVERKWLKCILWAARPDGAGASPASKQMLYCNSAIKTTLVNLNPYESVMLFSYLFYKHGEDGEFIRPLFGLLVRWYLCLKYNLLLAEYPFLGSVSTFNNLVWGLRSVPSAWYSFLSLATGIHETIHELLEPILAYRSSGDRASGAIPPDDNVVDHFPVLSNFQPGPEPQSLCEGFSQYLFDAALSLGAEEVPLRCDGGEGALGELRRRISQFKFESGCTCTSHLYLVMLDSYATAALRAGRPPELVEGSVKGLVGLYAKWLLTMTSAKNVQTSVLRAGAGFIEESGADPALQEIQKLVEAEEWTYFRVKSEHGGPHECGRSIATHSARLEDWMPSLFSRFLARCLEAYESYESVPDSVLVLSYAFMSYDSARPYRVCRDLPILEGTSLPEPLTLQLFHHEIGREMVLRFDPKLRWWRIEDWQEHPGDGPHEGTSLHRVFECCHWVYDSILRAGGLQGCPGEVKIYASTTLTSDADRSHVLCHVSPALAHSFLDELWRALESNRDSVSSLSIPSESAWQSGRLSEQGLEFMRGATLLPCAIIAIATVMQDEILLDFSCEHAVRVLVGLRSVCTASDLLGLVLRLLYAEVADDFVLALEHGDPELALYRTMLLRYALQLAVSPINATRRVRFSFNGRVELGAFAARIFKFLNFRTNYVLMDPVVFDKYLTTRVVSDFSGEAGSPGAQAGAKSSPARFSPPDDAGDALVAGRFCEGLARSSPSKQGEGAPERSAEEVQLRRILGVFGFLEYLRRRRSAAPTRVPVKSEDQPQGERYFDAEYFFGLPFKFLGALRLFAAGRGEFAAELLDQYTFKYYLRLCSNDFYDAANTGLIYSSLRHVLSTSQQGQPVENTLLAHFFGPLGVSNEFMESLGLMDNRRKKPRPGRGHGRAQLVDLLRLGNRYTKRVYYRIAHMFCSGFLSLVPLECLTGLLCSWASCLPTDCTSAVRSEKTAVARFVLFRLLARVCSLPAELSLRALGRLEPLVSAVNVVFVNLDIVFRGRSSRAPCEVISDEEELAQHAAPELQRLMSGQLDLADAGSYDRLVGEYRELRARSARRFRERREAVRRRNREQVRLLLRVALVLSRVLDSITQRFHGAIADPSNSYVATSGERTFVSCIGKRRSVFYATLDFLALVENTVSNVIRTCVLATLVLSQEPDSGEGACDFAVPGPGPKAPKLEGDSCAGTPTYTPNSHSYPSVEHSSRLPNGLEVGSDASIQAKVGTEVVGSQDSSLQSQLQVKVEPEDSCKPYSELIAGIKLVRERIRARASHLAGLHRAEGVSSDAETPRRGPSEGHESASENGDELDGALSDDLDDFIDFETDRHLSMLTYGPGKRARAARVRLRVRSFRPRAPRRGSRARVCGRSGGA